MLIWSHRAKNGLIMDDKTSILIISYNQTIIVVTRKVGLYSVVSILTTMSMESNTEHETLFNEKIMALSIYKWHGKLGRE